MSFLMRISACSTKGPLYHAYLTNPTLVEQTYFVDPILASPSGHQVLAEVLIHFIQQQICASWSSALGYSFDVPAFKLDAASGAKDGSHWIFGGAGGREGANEDEKEVEGSKKDDKPARRIGSSHPALTVPPFLLSTRPDNINSFVEVAPHCVSSNNLINPVPPSLFYGTGWHPYAPPKDAPEGDDFYYWHASFPKSKVRIPLKVGAGDVAIWYLSEPSSVVGHRGSSISCWVDNNYAGAVAISNLGTSDTSQPSYVSSTPNRFALSSNYGLS